MIITAAKVKQFINTVSSEDIGRAHKFYNLNTKTAYYLVESSDKIDETTGEPIEYRVSYSKEKGFQCSCPSGQYGFANVKHASGVCSHVRIAVAAAQEERTAMAEMALSEATQVLAGAKKPVLIINGKEATAEEYDRVMNAKPKPVRTVKGNLTSNQGFSLLRK